MRRGRFWVIGTCLEEQTHDGRKLVEWSRRYRQLRAELYVSTGNLNQPWMNWTLL